uniref:Uncharacterized protein n=1 Tax=Myotis myotis TaxID=51298 RepID=A0A7J7ZYK1_MYOMY|nr:hypothetical protein mMyoMyo1_009703 [Myotis myotis]
MTLSDSADEESKGQTGRITCPNSQLNPRIGGNLGGVSDTPTPPPTASLSPRPVVGKRRLASHMRLFGPLSVALPQNTKCGCACTVRLKLRARAQKSVFCGRATLKGPKSRMWLASRSLPTTDLDP